jgi:hypothetical protein
MSGIPPYNSDPNSINPYEVPTPVVPPEADRAVWQYDRGGAGHGLRSANLSAADPIGMLSSNTIRALLVGIVALATSFGLKWVVTEQQTDAIVQGIGALVTLGSMVAAWYFRVKARKVVEPGASGSKESEPTPDVLAKMVGWLMLGTGAGIMLGGVSGCGNKGTAAADMSPLSRIYVARQAYTATLDSLNTAIETGFIPASRVPLLRALKKEISSGLDSAEAFARAGDTTSYKFWIERVESALTRYLELTQPIAPTTRPTTAPAARASELQPPEASSWTPQLLPYSSSTSSRSAVASSALSRALRRERNLPRRSRRRFSRLKSCPRRARTNFSRTLRRVNYSAAAAPVA